MNDLNLLYLKKVIETKNITLAAKELFISQPALSRSIKHAEEKLGFALFIHNGRNLELTPYAEVLYPYIKKALQTIDEGLVEIHKMQNLQTKNITLYLEVISCAIPALITNFQKTYPEVQLNIYQHHLPQNDDPIFYICSEPKPNLTNIAIYTEPILFAMPKNHPLAAKKYLTINEMLSIPIIALSEKNSLRHTLNNYFDKYGYALNISHTIEDPAALRTLLHSQLGASFYPKLSWDFTANDAFVLKEIRDFSLERTIYLASPFEIDHPVTNHIISILKEFFES